MSTIWEKPVIVKWIAMTGKRKEKGKEKRKEKGENISTGGKEKKRKRKKKSGRKKKEKKQKNAEKIENYLKNGWKVNPDLLKERSLKKKLL